MNDKQLGEGLARLQLRGSVLCSHVGGDAVSGAWDEKT